MRGGREDVPLLLLRQRRQRPAQSRGNGSRAQRSADGEHGSGARSTAQRGAARRRLCATMLPPPYSDPITPQQSATLPFTAHLLALLVVPAQQLQRAIALERAERVPQLAIDLGHEHLLAQALGDLIRDVERRRRVLDRGLDGAVGQHDLDGHRGLARLLDLRLLAGVEALKQLYALLVEAETVAGVVLEAEVGHRLGGGVYRRGCHVALPLLRCCCVLRCCWCCVCR